MSPQHFSMELASSAHTSELWDRMREGGEATRYFVLVETSICCLLYLLLLFTLATNLAERAVLISDLFQKASEACFFIINEKGAREKTTIL